MANNEVCTHEQAMAIITATSRVVALSYEEAVVAYLRARRILRDSAQYLAAPVPAGWTPVLEAPKPSLREVIEETNSQIAKNEAVEKTDNMA